MLLQSWQESAGSPAASSAGAFHFTLINAGPDPVTVAGLCYGAMTRIAADAPASAITGARLLRRDANHHHLIPDAPLTLGPQDRWTITIGALSHAPTNRTQGAMAAWVILDDGRTRPVLVTDLTRDPPAPDDPKGDKSWPLGAWPDGTPPLALLPWPASLSDITTAAPPCGLRTEGAGLTLLANVAALHRRLFPLAPSLIHPNGVRVVVETAPQPDEGFTLTFAPDRITLTSADEGGARYGMIALAQMLHGAREGEHFAFPRHGQMRDAPRFGFRGLHVDVARNFRTVSEMRRILDIMAWHRLNYLHWHLTDDEGWRIEIPALPTLTEIGAKRGFQNGARSALSPQYADGPEGQQGYYTVAEARDLVAHARQLGIQIIPEIDAPGHMTALLTAIDDLRDPGETPESYRSVQGYPNNALNPAIPRVYEVMDIILTTICDIFPAPVIHIGGDEVDANAWQHSPAARALAAKHGFATPFTAQMQTLFLSKMQDILTRHSRRMGGWDECADGADKSATLGQGALLFAWRSVEKTAELMAKGYDVIATPGQAYYLDMVQGPGWAARGTSWAGAVDVAQTYGFEPSEGLSPNDTGGRLLGIEACVWSEHLDSVDRWNDAVFPRLSAVAETAWTPPEVKDFNRFCLLSHRMPQL